MRKVNRWMVAFIAVASLLAIPAAASADSSAYLGPHGCIIYAKTPTTPYEGSGHYTAWASGGIYNCSDTAQVNVKVLQLLSTGWSVQTQMGWSLWQWSPFAYGTNSGFCVSGRWYASEVDVNDDWGGIAYGQVDTKTSGVRCP